MTLQTIPLNKLVPAASNVRKTGALSIDDLAASIAAHGLLQNLQVRALWREDGKPTGKFEVVAGGRRLAALKRLAKEKRVAKDHAVPCNVLGTENGTEISLAENVVRQAMHPADQFEAFNALASQGHDVEDIAARFGATATHVKKLLRLASVSPALMAAYRDGQMTLEQLMAFTVTSDHDAQERVWAERLEHHPAGIRRALTEAWVSANHHLARFIGLDAYTAAGGAIVRDLFQEDHDGYLADRALLERLVREKLDRLAEDIRAEGWQWVEIVPDYRHPASHGFSQLAPEKRPLSDAEAAEQDALYTEYDALASDDVEDAATATRLDAIAVRLEELAERAVLWVDEVKTAAGVALHIRQDGSVAIERGLVREADLPQPVNDNDAPARKIRPALPASLVRDLTAHRTAALRATLAIKPEVALDATVYTLALPLFYDAGAAGSCLQIRFERVALDKEAEGIGESPAMQRLQRLHDVWARQLPEAGLFWPWLREQPQARKLELLAFCVAQSLQAVQPRLDEHPSKLRHIAHADALHLATGLDMAEWWQPTRAHYLGRVSRSLVLEALTEAVSRECADGYRERKRDALIGIAERKLSGTRWLPALLREPGPVSEAETEPSLPNAA